MITNATITQMEVLGGVDAMGQSIFGSTFMGFHVPCLICGVTTKQHWQLGATIKDATRVLYLEKQELRTAGLAVPGLGHTLTMLLEGESALTMQVVALGEQVLDTLSHYEVYLKPV